jgi:hypothetical protein
MGLFLCQRHETNNFHRLTVHTPDATHTHPRKPGPLHFLDIHSSCYGHIP